MAALDFPSSPSVGQAYSANGSTWTWNGTSWVSQNAGVRVLLGTYTASSSAALTLTNWYSASYDIYEVEIIDLVPTTDNVALSARISTDNGSSYDTGSNYRQLNHYAFSSSSISGATLGTSIDFGGNRSNSATYNSFLTLKLYMPGNSRYKMIDGRLLYYNASASNLLFGNFECQWQNTSAYNALQFTMSSGNISGTARVYGLN